MSEILVLIGQIVIISVIQQVVEIAIDKDKRPQLVQILNMVCITGCFYLFLQFAFTHVLTELMAFVRIAF